MTTEQIKSNRTVIFNMIASNAQKDLERYQDIVPYFDELVSWTAGSEAPADPKFSYQPLFDIPSGQMRLLAWYKPLTNSQNQWAPALLIGYTAGTSGCWAAEGHVPAQISTDAEIAEAAANRFNNNNQNLFNLGKQEEIEAVIMRFVNRHMSGHARFKTAINQALGNVMGTTHAARPSLI